MHVVKENRTYLVADANGEVGGALGGVFRDDTRMLSVWRWTLGDAKMLSVQVHEDTLHAHHAVINDRRSQTVGLSRRLAVRDDGLDDTWTIENTSDAPQFIVMTLDCLAEFRDLFTMLRQVTSDGDRTIDETELANGKLLTRVASDGLRLRAEVTYETIGGIRLLTEPQWTFELQPGDRATLIARVRFTVEAEEPRPALPSYGEWRESFDLRPADPDKARSIVRAIDDLRALLLGTTDGSYPAAGLPWFSCIFGRDALITASMLLPWRPDIAMTVLARLARDQGKVVDPFREEEPGKILHEVRLGELSRIGKIPFGRYYGSVDATPLYVSVLGEYVASTGDVDAITRLRPTWEAAIRWLEAHRADTGDLVAFAPSGSGLAVQSWKDSPDSMNHADGRPAEAPLAVAEVQGYAFAAFRTAAGFYRSLGLPDRAAECDVRAERLAEELHARFWLEDMGTYAMALDRYGKPLRVLSSDPGHLLWSGVVPEAVAPRLVETLMGPALWSGWGIRTLGQGHTRFNAVSYHNGSVWPHDTAILAGGLVRYGFVAQAQKVATALFDLASSQPMNSLPELLSGFQRVDALAPIAYTHACRPQAWAAAGLLYAARAAEIA